MINKILIIDDNFSIVNIMKKFFESKNHTISFSLTFDEHKFPQEILANNYDIILLDYMLDESTGIDVLKKIRTVSDIPVIMITGYSSTSLAVEFMKSGGNDFMQKPVNFEILEIKINNYIANYKKEKELQKSKELWYLTMSSLPNYVLILDNNFNIINSNKPLKELDDEVEIGSSFTNLFLSSEYPAIHSALKKMKSSEFKTKSELWFAINFKRSSASSIIAVLTDITLKKNIDKTLSTIKNEFMRQSSDENYRLSQAIKQIPLSIIITNKEKIIEYVNPRFEEITGYFAEDLVGISYNKIKASFHGKSFYNQIWDNIQNGEIWCGELYNMKKNGDFFWERTTISPIRDNKGNILNFIKIGEDITETKQMEIELKIAQQKSESANIAKNIFLSNMSHELKTPLNGILGLSETMLRYKNLNNLDEAIIDKNLHEIIKCGHQLSGIVSDILEMSKIETDGVKLQETYVNIEDILNKVVVSFVLPVKKKNLLFYTNIGKNLYTFGDSNKIEQIVKNLLSNALKFTSEGFIGVNLNEEDNKIIISISDSGIGISEENLDKIFDRFTRVDETGTTPGAGLGLSISKNLALAMGGDITVSSTLGKGSIFSLILAKGKGDKNE